MHAVEAHAEQMLDPLGVTPSVQPGACLSGDAWYARESDNAAVVGGDAELALS